MSLCLCLCPLCVCVCACGAFLFQTPRTVVSAALATHELATCVLARLSAVCMGGHCTICGALSPQARSFGTGMPPERHSVGSRRDKAPPEAEGQRKARAPGGRLAVGASVALVAAAALQHLGRPPQTVDTVPRVEFWSVDSDRQREARTETAAAEVVQRVAAGRRPVVLTGSPVREWRAIRDGTWSPDRHRATLAS